MKKLQALLKAIMLRRKKDSKLNGEPVLQLPPKREYVEYADLSRDEFDYYKQLEEKSQVVLSKYLRKGSIGKNYFHILVLPLRLRQACCHPHLNLDVEDTANFVEDAAVEKLVKQLDKSIVERIKRTKAFECPICYDAVQSPSFLIPCGHDSCTDCVSRVVDNAASQNLRHDDGSNRTRCPALTAKDRENVERARKPKKGSGKGEVKERAKDKGNGNGKEGSDVKPSMLKGLRLEAGKNRVAYERYMSYLQKTWMPAAKVTKCISLLRQFQETGQKTIVFSQWTLLLDLLQVAMRHENFADEPLRYDGSMSGEQRSVAATEFRDRPEVKVMLVSLRAGNAGLNLTAASRVIIMDPFWNPYIEMQAIDRTYRIGQRSEVEVYRILTKETVEDRIVKLQQKKREIVDAALDESASMKIGRLSNWELRFLFNAV